MHRQSQIFAREGVDLDRSILARWVGEAAALLEPVAEVLRRYVLEMNSEPEDASSGIAEVAGGAVDAYLGAYLGVLVFL